MALRLLLFPVLVALVIPYLLVGLIGAGSFVSGVTRGMLPNTFPGIANEAGVMMNVGAVPPWVTGLVISAVVLFYVFFGGVRSTAWANTFQTIVFMIMGAVAVWLIARAMGGAAAASAQVAEHTPKHLAREGMIGKAQFFSYCFIPLSVGMFPHLFQHWLTARSARAFRLTVVAHPLCIMLVWVPCILIGIWGAGMVAAGELRQPPTSNAILGIMVSNLVKSDVLTGLLAAGVLAAIMSSLDSQFVCIR